MSVAAVSANSSANSNIGNPASNILDKEIQALQNQKEVLQEQIERTKTNDKLDLKQKNELITEYQKQIVEIDGQIREKQLEKLKPKEVDKQEPATQNQPQDEYVKGELGDASLTGAMNLTSLCSQYSGMLKLRKGITNQIAVTRSEATEHSNIQKKMEEVNKLEDRKKELEKRMTEKMEEMQGEQEKQVKKYKDNKAVKETKEKEPGDQQQDDDKETKNKDTAIDVLA